VSELCLERRCVLAFSWGFGNAVPALMADLPKPDAPSLSNQGHERLESWKEIAIYFGRSTTTVQRWEAEEGLPVHRLEHSKKGSVFAFKGELEAWRAARTRPAGGQIEARQGGGPGDTLEPAAPAAHPKTESPTDGTRVDENLQGDLRLAGRDGARLLPYRTLRPPLVAVAAILVLTVAAVGFAWGVSWSGNTVPEVPTDMVVLSPHPGNIILKWRDVSTNETHFEIDRRPPTDATFAAFSNLNAGTSYHWRIRACNGSACSAWHPVIGKTPDGSDPVPDGPAPAAVGGATDILFASTRDAGSLQIYLMHADGSAPTRLTNSQANNRAPVWSPDRTRIAFTSDRTGFSHIYLMNADGLNQVRLTGGDSVQDTDPTWSPDGDRIAFCSNRSGDNEIWVVNSDGSRSVRLTTTRGDDGQPAWSPDGSRIAFVSARSGGYDIYVMQSDGTDQKRLTTDGAYNGFPAWSSDSKRITFRSSRDRNQEVYVMNADGSGQSNLTRHPAEDNDSAWSPDGTRIAFRTNRSGHNDIYSMNAEGSRPTLLTNSPAEELDIDWGFPRAIVNAVTRSPKPSRD
jgi:Tol biopolymer transport system component